MFREVLNKYELIFDITLGTWKTKPVDIELQPGEKPYHAKPHPVTGSYKAVFRKEAERLCQLGASKKTNRSEWEPPHSFNGKRIERYDS